MPEPTEQLKCGLWGCGRPVTDTKVIVMDIHPRWYSGYEQRVITTVCDYHLDMIEKAENRKADEEANPT